MEHGARSNLRYVTAPSPRLDLRRAQRRRRAAPRTRSPRRGARSAELLVGTYRHTGGLRRMTSTLRAQLRALASRASTRFSSRRDHRGRRRGLSPCPCRRRRRRRRVPHRRVPHLCLPRPCRRARRCARHPCPSRQHLSKRGKRWTRGGVEVWMGEEQKGGVGCGRCRLHLLR